MLECFDAPDTSCFRFFPERSAQDGCHVRRQQHRHGHTGCRLWLIIFLIVMR